jgi:hypothetical protein
MYHGRVLPKVWKSARLVEGEYGNVTERGYDGQKDLLEGSNFNKGKTRSLYCGRRGEERRNATSKDTEEECQSAKVTTC